MRSFALKVRCGACGGKRSGRGKSEPWERCSTLRRLRNMPVTRRHSANVFNGNHKSTRNTGNYRQAHQSQWARNCGPVSVWGKPAV